MTDYLSNSLINVQAITAAVEKEEIKKRWDALYNELVAALGYLPLTIHWCVLFSSFRVSGLPYTFGVHTTIPHGNEVVR